MQRLDVLFTRLLGIYSRFVETHLDVIVTVTVTVTWALISADFI